MNTVEWANPPVDAVPRLRVPPPGPRSASWHARMTRHVAGGVTPMASLFPVAFESGLGVTLTDVDGNTYLDFASGIVVTGLGHSHPVVAEAVARAAHELDNVHDFATPHKVQALEALASITPPGMTLAALFSSGAEAVEAALRVARAATGRDAFVSFHHHHHGSTSASASITDASTAPATGQRDGRSLLVPSGSCYRCSFRLQPPSCGLRCATFVGEAIEDEMSGEVAAVVAEVVTNAGGATVYQPGYLPTVVKAAHEAGALFIADEVASGMGRTGRWFAVDHEGVVPDVMAIGKGLGNGFPVTAIAVKEEYADALSVSFPATSYGGNPMASAAVAAVIEVMQREALVDHAADLGDFALGRLSELAARHPIVGDARGRGALLALELVKDPESKEPFPEAGAFVYRHAFAHGVVSSLSGHILRLTPPLVMTPEIFAKGLEIIEEAIAAAEAEFGYA